MVVTAWVILISMVVASIVFKGPLVLKIIYIWGGITSVLNHGLMDNYWDIMDRITMLSWIVLDIYYVTQRTNAIVVVAICIAVLSLCFFLASKVILFFKFADRKKLNWDDILGRWKSDESKTALERIREEEAVVTHIIAHLLISVAHVMILAFYYCMDVTTTDC